MPAVETQAEETAAVETPVAETEAKSDKSVHLPAGWIAAVDSESGTTYYQNEETGETSWDVPQGAAVDQEASDGAPVPIVLHAQEEYAELDKPGQQVDSIEELLPPGWIAVVDDDSGQKYYQNEDTGESSWDVPQGAAVDQEASDVAPVPTVQHAQEENTEMDKDYSLELLPGWYAVVDDESGQTYYQNDETGESSWEVPRHPE